MRYHSTELITKAQRKHHGKLKGNSKKETKLLKATCNHHIYTKKGNQKPMIHNNGDGTAVCPMCKAIIPTKLMDDATVKSATEKVTRIVNQAKFLNIAIDGGTEADKFLVDTAVHLMQISKVYSKIRKVASKKDAMKGKKKKNRNNQGSSLGSWGPRTSRY